MKILTAGRFLALGLVIATTACPSGGAKEERRANVDVDGNECFFPDDGVTPAPGWVCKAPVEGYTVFDTGDYEKTGAGPDFQENMAAANARKKLAFTMQSHVKAAVKQFTERTGKGDAETVDAVATDVSNQLTDANLVGAKIIRVRLNPATKHMYVLVGLDQNSVKATTQNAVKTSLGNNQAQWQKFLADKAQNDLAAEIANMAAERAAGLLPGASTNTNAK